MATATYHQPGAPVAPVAPTDPRWKVTTDDIDRITSDVLVMTSRAFAIAALVLVSIWAASNKSQYLGLPTWHHNSRSWHAVLMVAGFFFCLIFANTIYLDKTVDKRMHWLATRWVQVRMWFWKCGIIAFGITAMVAIVQWKNRANQSHEATFHAWIGSLSVGTVFYYIIIEGIRQSLKASNINETGHPYTFYVYRMHQEFIGLMAMISTTLAIITGVSDYLEATGGCNYGTGNEKNIYQNLSSACRLANGMSFCVFFATVFAMLAAALHTVNYYHQTRVIRLGNYLEIVQPNKNSTALIVTPDTSAGGGYHGAAVPMEKHHHGVLTNLDGGTVEDGKEGPTERSAV